MYEHMYEHMHAREKCLQCFDNKHLNYTKYRTVNVRKSIKLSIFIILQVKVNALIKRASIKLQLSRNSQDNEAIKLDPNNADIYHHRGQVGNMASKKTYTVNVN